MTDVTKDLFELKGKIEDAKERKSNLDGKLETLFEQLDNDYNISTIEAGKKKCKVIMNTIDKLEKQLEQGLSDLKENYDWE